MHHSRTGAIPFWAMLSATALFACAMVVGANALMDPYGVWRLLDLPGVNSHKPAARKRVKLVKAHDLRWLAPEAIVLGTSRSHVALRPAHEGWGVADGRRYNAAFDGATTREMEAYLRHAQAVHPLRQVVLGLDTWQIGRGPASVRPDFDPGLLHASRGPLRPLGAWAAEARLLLSLDTLRASVDTLFGQTQNVPEWLAADGQRLGDVFFRKVEMEFQLRGTGDYLRAIDRQEAGFKIPIIRPRPPSTVTPPGDGLTSFDHIARIVAFCREQGIDLRVHLTPAHAHQMELAAQAGEWPAIEQGKRDLVALLARDAEAHPNMTPFMLIDFSGYSSVTTESVPSPGDIAEMTCYWDSSHYKEIVGDWILDRLLRYTRRDAPSPPDFGVILTPQTIDAALNDIRHGREAYRRDHSADVAFISELVTRARAGRPSGG